jgi:hypothetical protein
MCLGAPWAGSRVLSFQFMSSDIRILLSQTAVQNQDLALNWTLRKVSGIAMVAMNMGRGLSPSASLKSYFNSSRLNINFISLTAKNRPGLQNGKR